jgi:hypothetical protein
MQSFLHGALLHDSGYFHIWISAIEGASFFTLNDDKAFFMILLQDSLSPQKKLDEQTTRTHGYSSEIDLLAYSLTTTGAHLLVHTSRKASLEDFGQALLSAYQTYLQEKLTLDQLPFDTIFVFDKLAGRHEALGVSRDIHLLHEDWRGDRYSSIGFYLDDRRGDWMRPYRLTSLFEAKPKLYVRFLKSLATESDRLFDYIET